jgi:uncharacterized protein with GYD domain
MLAEANERRGCAVARYLWKVSYTVEGAKGLLKDGGTVRQAEMRKVVKQAGGKLEAFYFALGESDAYMIAELRDSASVAAVSLAIFSSGGARITTVPLMTPAEMDVAVMEFVNYTPPGR